MFPSAPTEIGFDVSMTSLPGKRSATSSITVFIGPSQRARTTVSARCTASRLLGAAVARLPISAVTFARSSWFTADRTTGSPPAPSSRATVPPMFPIPMIAVVMSVLLEQSFGGNDLDDFLHRFQPGPVALQLNRERHPAVRPCASLNHALRTRAMGRYGCAADRADHPVTPVRL